MSCSFAPPPSQVLVLRRSNYVQIEWQNMIDSAYLQFIRYTSFEVDSLSVPYDYASIMHYPTNVS